jgi:hypothetical protein
MSEIKNKLKIRGQIDYSLIIDENDEWLITFESNADNDIAAVAMTQHIMETVCSGLSAEIKNVDNVKYKRHLKAILEKGMAAHFGGKLILEYMQNIYLDFKKNNPDMVDSVADEAKAAENQLKMDTESLKDPFPNSQLADESNV